MSDSKESSYKVGYRRPPQHTRFRPGASGNPKGRPRGSQNMATILEQELEKKVTIVENGRHRKYPKSVLAIRQLVNKAVSGDLRAVRQLVDLELRLNPEGVRQPTFVEIFRRLAAEVDEAKTSNDDLP